MLKPEQARQWVITWTIIALVMGGSLAAWQYVSHLIATDGGGTNSVSPTIVPAAAESDTLTFTYEADAIKDSGDMTITVPNSAGWSAPQGNSGTAGYTTATSGSGVVGDVEDTVDAIPEWEATNHMNLAIVAGTAPYVGIQRLKNTIHTKAVANEQWYYDNTSSENWGANNGTGNLRVGMFMTSEDTVSAGDYEFRVDDSASLASPLDTVNIPALTADTGVYRSVALGAGSRNSVASYGYRYVTDNGATSFKSAKLAPIFDGAEGTTNWTGDTAVSVSTNTFGGVEGTNSIKCTFGVSAIADAACYRSNGGLGGNFTIGPGSTVNMWVRPSIAMSAGDLVWLDNDGAAIHTTPEDTVDLPALDANVWTFVELTATGSDNLSVRSYGIKQSSDLGAFTLDIDGMGKRVNNTSSLTNWEAPTAGSQLLFIDNTTKKEGNNSMLNTVDATAVAGDQWYRNPAASEDWSAYTKVGFWMRSDVAVTSGQIHFQYDNVADLLSPIATVNIGALTANTWTWKVLTLTGTRSTVASYGFKHTVDIGAANIRVDYFLLGPGSPTFNSPAEGSTDIQVIFLDLNAGQTVTVTYGSGGGTSGVTTPSSAGTTTFTTKDRDASDTTLSAIASSPTVLVNTKPVLGTISDSPDPILYGNTITFSSGTWTDDNAGETVKLFVCKTNELTSQSLGGCASGTWAFSSFYTTTNPKTENSTTEFADIATSPNTYYTFACDSKQVSNSCSASSSGTFTVEDQQISMSLSENSLTFGTVDSIASRYANSASGSATEVQAHLIEAMTNSNDGYIITVKGDSLTRNSFIIEGIGGANTAPNPGTEQFGLRIDINSGTGSVVAPYAASGFAYAADATNTDIIASGAGDRVNTAFSLRYLVNVSGASTSGLYTAGLQYVVTPTF